MRVYPRHHLDLTVGHLLYAAFACCSPADSDRLARFILVHGGRADGIVCFSVRSGFELLLEALELPHGSEVVVSANYAPGHGPDHRAARPVLGCRRHRLRHARAPS
jgi:perosamine synthetase